MSAYGEQNEKRERKKEEKKRDKVAASRSDPFRVSGRGYSTGLMRVMNYRCCVVVVWLLLWCACSFIYCCTCSCTDAGSLSGMLCLLRFRVRLALSSASACDSCSSACAASGVALAFFTVPMFNAGRPFFAPPLLDESAADDEIASAFARSSSYTHT